jgi:hypothetical protein
MTTHRHREETVNTQLALIISKLGVSAEAETILSRGSALPDVIFPLMGLRIVIEGKFADHSNARATVLKDARGRIQTGIAHIAAAVIYPTALRHVATANLERELSNARLEFKIVHESGESDDWFGGNPNALMDWLRRAQALMAEDNVVEQTARSLSDRLDGVAHLMSAQKGVCDRLSIILGMNAPKGEKPDDANARRETAAKVGALVIANALVFQEQLAFTDQRVSPLRKIEKAHDLVSEAASEWQAIWSKINYIPIFQLGERVLNELPASRQRNIAFKALLTEARNICANQAALRHDLMGRVFHWLLHYAKYLGAYYTSVSAATLLLKLALSEKWELDFGDVSEIATLRVADLACGTGTLLMAAAQSISDAYITSRSKSSRPLTPGDLDALHKRIMEDVLYGYDVLPSAVHLTASTLALLAPAVSFVGMNLFVMPLGVESASPLGVDATPRLGSLDFLASERLETQLSLDESQSEIIKVGVASSRATGAEVPKLDLCVMNPPFVRSVGGNLLFGSLPDERGRMQTRLKHLVSDANHAGHFASITAGLGSVFAALADQRLKSGGRMAFVLPAALASGEAWGETRRLISNGYHLEIVVTSHDPARQNFSENTSLSEILFIARKLRKKESPGDTKFVNLWRNPRTIYEALDIAERVRLENGTSINAEGFTSIETETHKIADVVTTPHIGGDDNWTAALFAQTELLRTAWRLSTGDLIVPGKRAVRFPVCALEQMGALGPDRKRIHEGFKVSLRDTSPYPGFWGHKSELVKTLSQQPNCYLINWLESPRGPGYGKHLWKRAGTVLLVERLRTNTHRVVAVRFDTEVLGNTWWAFKSSLSSNHIKSLVLWLNSTLGILTLFARRVVTQGAWMQFKQPAWEKMPVLDVRTLSPKQVNALASAYDAVCKTDLQAISELNSDDVRIAIDDAVTAALKLPNISYVRTMLANESGLSGAEEDVGEDDALAENVAA